MRGVCVRAGVARRSIHAGTKTDRESTDEDVDDRQVDDYQVSLGIEPRFADSESAVITATLQDRFNEYFSSSTSDLLVYEERLPRGIQYLMLQICILCPRHR